MTRIFASLVHRPTSHVTRLCKAGLLRPLARAQRRDPKRFDAALRYASALGDAEFFMDLAAGRVYPASHPAAQYVRNGMERLELSGDVSAYVVDDSSVNAYALANGKVAIHSGFLRSQRWNEELVPLLAHERRHVTASDYAYGVLYGRQSWLKRMQELSADVAMLTDTDNAGENPYGAPLFFETIDRADPENRKGRDETHGSPLARAYFLKRAMQYMPLAHASPVVHQLDHSALALDTPPAIDPAAVRWDSLSVEEFWSTVGWLLRKGVAFDYSDVMRGFTRSRGVILDTLREDTLITVLFAYVFKRGADIDTLEFPPALDKRLLGDPEVLSDLIENGSFEKLGARLLPKTYINLAEPCFEMAFAGTGAKEGLEGACRSLNRLRKAMAGVITRLYGESKYYLKEWDTACMAELFVSVYNPSTSAVKVAKDEDRESKGHRGSKILTLESNIHFQDMPPETPLYAHDSIGIETVDFYRVMRSVSMRAIPEDYWKEGFRFDGVSKNRLRRFLGSISDALLPVYEKIEAAVKESSDTLLEEFSAFTENTGGKIILSDWSDNRDVWDKNPFMSLREILIYGTRLFRGINDRAVRYQADLMENTGHEELTASLEGWSRKEHDSCTWSARARRVFSTIVLDQHNLNLIESSDLAKTAGQRINYALCVIFSGNGKEGVLEQVDKAYFTRKKVRDRNDSVVSKEIIQTVSAAVALRNRLELGYPLTFNRADIAGLYKVLGGVKHVENIWDNIDDSGKASAGVCEGIFSEALKVVEEWPISPLARIPQPEFDPSWRKVSRLLGEDLEKRPNFPSTGPDFEKVLAVTCFAQDSLAALTMSSLAYREMVARAPTFEEALRLVKKYAYLPAPIIEEGLEVLQNRASTPDEMRQLRECIDSAVEWLKERGQSLIDIEEALWFGGQVNPDERFRIFCGMTKTGSSDRELKELLASRWWAVFNREADLENIATLAVTAEMTGEREKKEAAAYRACQPFGEFNRPFESYYSSLYYLNPLLVQLTLRGLLLEGGDRSLLADKVQRRKLIESFVEEYIVVDKGNARACAVRNAFIDSLCDVPDAEELFYFVAPMLSCAALQMPDKPCTADDITDMLLKRFLANPKIKTYGDPDRGLPRREDFEAKGLSVGKGFDYDVVVIQLKREGCLDTEGCVRRGFRGLDDKKFPGLGYPQLRKIEEVLREALKRGLMLDTPGAFEYTKRLLRERIKAMVTGVLPDLEYSESEGLRAVATRSFERFEDMMFKRCSAEGAKRPRVIRHNMRPIALAAAMSEQMGSLPVVLMQRVGSYYDLPETDKRVTRRLCDKAKGQSKAVAWARMEREARDNRVFTPLFGRIAAMPGEPIGSGSKTTVFKAVTTGGEEVAVGVVNPGASLASHLLAEFADRIITAARTKLSEKLFDADTLEALDRLRVLVRIADRSIFEEVNDRDYAANNIAFKQANESMEHMGKRIHVPEIVDTGTPAITWDEMIDGEDFAGLEIVDGPVQTDIGRKVISREDALRFASLAANNFIAQVSAPGKFHPDIHVGQYRVMRKNPDIVAILDRKKLRSFNEAEHEFLAGMIQLLSFGQATGSVSDTAVDRAINFFAADLGPDPVRDGRIKERFSSRFNRGDPVASIGALLPILTDEKINIDSKWDDLLQSFIGLQSVCRWAGFEGIRAALLYTGQPRPIRLDSVTSVPDDSI